MQPLLIAASWSNSTEDFLKGHIESHHFLKIYLFNLFIFGCVGSSCLCKGFLQLRRAGATLHHGARASHYCGLSCCGAQAPDVQAQQLWLTGLVAPWHVGSSQTRARNHVPCIGRRTLNHCATREAPSYFYLFIYLFLAVLGLRVCARALSSCGERVPLLIAVRRPLTVMASLVAEHSLQTRRLSSCGSQAQLLRGMWDLPRPGLEPASPALAGGFSTTAPPGKPPRHIFKKQILCP